MVAAPVSGLVTATATTPAACGGMRTMICVEPMRRTTIAVTPPIVTEAVFEKPVPVTVSCLPATTVDEFAESDLIVIGEHVPTPLRTTVFELPKELLVKTRFAVLAPTALGLKK